MKINNLKDLLSDIDFDLSWPTRQKSLDKFENFNPIKYAKTRNFLHGQVSKLSPLIKHGVITNRKLFEIIRDKFSFSESEKFIQELAWRDFWKSYAYQHPEHLWTDVENYKTGFQASHYQNELPEDIEAARTSTQVINTFIKELKDTGYLHNHARMYLASYIVHFRQVKWQAGARFFLTHLLDGDIASNNFSWQWVASTFSAKPYIFNLDNIQKYCYQNIKIDPDQNKEIDGNYEEISARLFPNI